MSSDLLFTCGWCRAECRSHSEYDVVWADDASEDRIRLCTACVRERTAALEAARSKRTNPPQLVAGRDLLIFDVVGGGVIVLRPDAPYRLLFPRLRAQGGRLNDWRLALDADLHNLNQAAEALADRAPDGGSL